MLRIVKAKLFGGEVEFSQKLDEVEKQADAIEAAEPVKAQTASSSTPPVRPPNPEPGASGEGLEASVPTRAAYIKELIRQLGERRGVVTGLPPAYRVTMAWNRLSQAIGAAARGHGLAVPRVLSALHMTALGGQVGLSLAEVRQIRELQHLRNQAVHESDHEITDTDALRYEDIVERLIQRLDAKSSDRPSDPSDGSG